MASATSRFRRISFAAPLAFYVAACDPAAAAHPARAVAAPSSSVMPTIDAGTVLLDVNRSGLTISARLATARADSDGDRVLILGNDAGDGLAGRRVLDARFVEDGVALLDTDHVLRIRDVDGETISLDDSVYGPLSVAGATIAYVRGAPPDLELARVDMRSRVVTNLTHDMAPVWSPALSDDGHEIVFVSGHGGAPRLHRLDASGLAHELPPSARTPSAPTAPRWVGSTLVFEDESGIAWLDLERSVVVRDVPRAHGLVALADGTMAGSTTTGSLTRLAPPAGWVR